MRRQWMARAGLVVVIAVAVSALVLASTGCSRPQPYSQTTSQYRAKWLGQAFSDWSTLNSKAAKKIKEAEVGNGAAVSTYKIDSKALRTTNSAFGSTTANDTPVYVPVTRKGKTLFWYSVARGGKTWAYAGLVSAHLSEADATLRKLLGKDAQVRFVLGGPGGIWAIGAKGGQEYAVNASADPRGIVPANAISGGAFLELVRSQGK